MRLLGEPEVDGERGGEGVDLRREKMYRTIFDIARHRALVLITLVVVLPVIGVRIGLHNPGDSGVSAFDHLIDISLFYVETTKLIRCEHLRLTVCRLTWGASE